MKLALDDKRINWTIAPIIADRFSACGTFSRFQAILSRAGLGHIGNRRS